MNNPLMFEERGSMMSPRGAMTRPLLAVGMTGANNLVAFTHWFYFRKSFLYLSLTAYVAGFVGAMLFCDDVDGYLLYGASVSLLFCALVLLSYVQVVPWRKHPSPLIFYRTVANTVFSLVLILNAFHVGQDPNATDDDLSDDDGCIVLSGVTQLALFTAEIWMAMIALDLFYSMTNPFTSYKNNLVFYHSVVWGFGLLNAFALMSHSDCRGPFVSGVCWINVGSALCPCFWTYYFGWIVLFYFSAVAILIYGSRRVNKGLEETLETRKRCVHSTLACVGGYAVYLTILAIVYFSFLGAQQEHSSSEKILSDLLAYLFASKGFFDASIWFAMNKFAKATTIAPPTKAALGEDQQRLTVSSLASTPTMLSDELDIDLSPQLNLALRQEVLHHVTQGITQAVSRTFDDFDTVHEFMLEDKYLFRDFNPAIFHQLRKLAGWQDHEYLTQLANACREQLSEGASGAFMFFSGDNSLIVKTISAEESAALNNIVHQYCSYLQTNPNSLLVRFFGHHSLQLYNQTFHFVVMKNIFPPDASINERYDIKGSWIDRHAAMLPPGRKAYCKHCNELFIVGSSERCPEMVSKHEPNTVLKDNDLKSKIRLQPEEAYAVIDAINKDSDLLASLGIMDYSLIVGVTNIQYEVDLHGDNLSSSRQSFSRQSFSRQSFSRPVVRRQDSPSEQSYDPSPATSLQDPNGSFGMADQQQQQEQQHQLTIDTASETGSVADDAEHGASFYITSPSVRPKSLRNQLSNLSSGQGTHGYAVRAVVGPGIYYLGIIDILQPWTMKKRLERFFKTTFLGKSASGLSCMPPQPYRDRFQRKISQLIEHTIFIREVTGSWKGPRFKSGPEYIDGI